MKVLAECFFRLTGLLKDLLTNQWLLRHGISTVKKCFICDGHPWLCVACHRLRYGLRYGRLPFALEIITRAGTHIWRTDAAPQSTIYWDWLNGILNRRIKQRYAAVRARANNETDTEVVNCS